MARAFSLMHSTEVVTAKIVLRHVLPAFHRIKETGFRPKDTRAMCFLRSALIRKLNKVTQPLTIKKAFTRWRVVINSSLLRYSIEKIVIHSKINNFVAMHRFLRIIRRRENPEEKYYEQIESMDNLIKKVNKLKDKYNSVDILIEKAFTRIKDHYIRCSKLIAFDSLLLRILERNSPKLQVFSLLKRAGVIKKTIIQRLISSYFVKQSQALSKLRHITKTSQWNEVNQVQDQVDIFRSIFARSIKQKLEGCLARCHVQEEGSTRLASILQKLEHNKKKQAFSRIYTIGPSVPILGPGKFTEAIKDKAKTKPSLTFLKIIEASKGRLNFDDAPSMRNTPKIERKTPKTVEKIETKSRKVTTVFEAFQPSKVASLYLILHNLELRRMMEFWTSFEKLAKLKKVTAALNALTKWKIKVIGEKAKEILKGMSTIIQGTHLINRLLKRKGRDHFKSAYWKTYTYAFVKAQIQKPVNFSKMARILRQVIHISETRRKVGFFTILYYSQMNRQSVEQIQSRVSSFLLRKLQGAAESSVDIITEAVQSKRVRKSKIKPILTSYNAEDHRGLNTIKLTLEDYIISNSKTDQNSLSGSKDGFDLLSNPYRKSDYNLELMRSVEMSEISHFSRDSDLKDIKATLSEFKGGLTKTFNQLVSKSMAAPVAKMSAPINQGFKTSTKLQSDLTYESEEVIGEEFLEEIEEVDQQTFDSLKRRENEKTERYYQSFKK